MKEKKIMLLLLALIGYCQCVFATPIINIPSSASFTVGNYGKVEIPFNMNTYSNPYDPNVINAYCEFWSPSNQYYKVYAFFYTGFTRVAVDLGTCDPIGSGSGAVTSREDLDIIPNSDKWLIRFTPNETGVWKYKITATDAGGTATFPSGSQKLPNFTCTSSSNLGFIVKANKRYLKRTTGEFLFPVGANDAWFETCGSHVYGTYEYKYYLDKMIGKSNYIRVWLDYYRGAAIVGYDVATQQLHSFDLYDQEDSWRMDYIFEYAKQRNINIQLCFFTHAPLGTGIEENGIINYDQWPLNPFNVANGGPISSPFDFFNDPIAIEKQKKLLKYIVSRWGYSTNLLAWELFNEADQVLDVNPIYPHPSDFMTRLQNWHATMYQFLKDVDPHDHLVTTSMGGNVDSGNANVFYYTDYTNSHMYYGPGADFQNEFYNTTINSHGWLDKPTMHCEWGIFNPNTLTANVDPYGFELHSTLWSSSFSTAMGAAAHFFWGTYVDEYNLWSLFKPVTLFMNAQPVLPETMVPYKFENINGMRLYCMAGPDLEYTYGWVQDNDFRFPNLFDPSNPLNPSSYLQTLDPLMKPPAGPESNNILIPAQANRVYIVEWYSAETGIIYQTSSATSTASGLTITIPNALRTSTYGDAVFKVKLDCDQYIWREGGLSNTPQTNVVGNVICNKTSGQVFYKASGDKINSYWWNPATQTWDWSNLNNAASNVAGDLVISPDGSTIYYRTNDNKIKNIHFDLTVNNWLPSDMNNAVSNAAGPLVVAPNNQIFYCATDNKIRSVALNVSTNTWYYDPLASGLPANCGNSIAIGPGTTAGSFEVFYKTTDNKINSLYKNAGVWTWSNLNNTASGVTSNIAVNSARQVFYTSMDSKMHQIYWGASGWLGGAALPGIPANVGGDIMVGPNGVNAEVFYRTTDNRLNSVYYTGTWLHSNLNNCVPVSNVVPGWISGTDFSSIYYRAANNTVRRIYYKSQCFTTPSPNFDRSAEVTDEQIGNEENSYIEELSELQASLQLYPNPASEKLIISSSEPIFYISIYSIAGEQLQNAENVNESVFELNTEKLGNGVYLARIHLKTGETIFRKFIVKND